MQRGNHLAERIDRIRHCSPVMAGVQVFVRTGDGHFQVSEPPHAAVDGGDLLRDHRRIADKDDVRGKKVPVVPHPRGQRRAPDFLLTLEDEFHVVAEPAGTQQVFERLEMHEQLPFVVIGAPGIDGFLPRHGVAGDDRIEGTRPPFFQRLRRLDVVMAVHQYGLLRAGNRPRGIDDRIARRLADLGHLGAGLKKKLLEPSGTAVHLGFVFGFGTDGRDTQQREELLEKPLPVLFDIGFHGGWISFSCKCRNYPPRKKDL